jgi:hypothetical protein
LPRSLEDVFQTFDVDAIERLRIGRPILGVGGQVKHAVATFHASHQGVPIGDIAPHEFDQFMLQRFQPVAVEAGRRIDTIAAAERPHALATFGQCLDQTHADESSRPGDENLFAIIHASGSFKSGGGERRLYSRVAAQHNSECIVYSEFRKAHRPPTPRETPRVGKTATACREDRAGKPRIVLADTSGYDAAFSALILAPQR